MIRGNHDDPVYFDGIKIIFDRLNCIPNYSVALVAKHKVLCIGGNQLIDFGKYRGRGSQSSLYTKELKTIVFSSFFYTAYKKLSTKFTHSSKIYIKSHYLISPHKYLHFTRLVFYHLRAIFLLLQPKPHEGYQAYLQCLYRSARRQDKISQLHVNE